MYLSDDRTKRFDPDCEATTPHSVVVPSLIMTPWPGENARPVVAPTGIVYWLAVAVTEADEEETADGVTVPTVTTSEPTWRTVPVG